MNTPPSDPILIDRLAAEYVLGTLRGAARRRFERWREVSPLVEARCRSWEERFMPFFERLKPVPPPPHVWHGIQSRLQLSSGALPRRRARALAVAASLAIVALIGALFYWRPFAPAPALETASIAAPSGALLWQIELSGHGREASELSVRAGAQAARPTSRDYELWALPKGGAPVSLGVLPYGAHTVRRVLSDAQRLALASAAQLAVSLEPPGGSPTGQPTGAVVFVATLRTAG